MTLRVKIVLIAILIVVGLLILFSTMSIVRYFRGGQEESAPRAPQTENGENDVEKGAGTDVLPARGGQAQTEPDSIVPPPPAAKPGDEITSLVLPFVERFGSYSNQGNFENLSDLLSFMSSSMRVWAQKQIVEQSEKPFQELYRGVTTKALSYTMKRYEPQQGRAEMAVTTQRKELIGSTVNARVYNQDVVVTLVKDDGAWVVDSAFWQ